MKKIEGGWNLQCSYTSLPEIFYTKIDPNPVNAPNLVVLNEDLANDLGLDADMLKTKEGIDILAGNEVLYGGFLLAQAYAGHQFGHFTVLGDGRAALIGEQINPQGKTIDIQLKGSGLTPYSRGGDGRATLSAMLREYIISEAMYGLGIPTTRSLSVVTTGEKVYRETPLEGAILVRTASSHIRVGTFQYAAAKGGKSAVKSLADYTINRHFPHVKDTPNPYIELLGELIKSQASLIAKWQLVGFIHGVMNTDNMAISGEAIDYGPCAFMNEYNSKTVFSSIDTQGRYAYQNQPAIAAWNLTRFAESFLTLIDDDQQKAISLAEEKLNNFEAIYNEYYINGMRKKLGLFDKQEGDSELINDLLSIMEKSKADYTNTFIALTFQNYKQSSKYSDEMFQSNEFKSWEKRWKERLSKQGKSEKEVEDMMKASNPSVIPRNHLVEEALFLASNNNDYSTFNELVRILQKPYNHEDINEKYTLPPKSSSVPYKTYCGT